MPEKLKSRKLYNMIKYAFCEVPLYEKNKVDYSEILESRDILDKICEIPVLEKDDAVINNDKLLSHEAIPLFLSQKLHKETTSGSTGKCMEVYWRKGDYQRSLLSLYVRRKMFYGINPGDKLCYFFSLRKFGHEEVHTERRPGQLGFCKSGRGQTAKVLKLTSGRINDYVITREGNRINSYVFVRAVEAVNRGLEQAIKQFTVIQRGYEDFEVKLVLRDLDERIMVEKIFLDNIFQKELKNAKFTFEFYNALFPDNKGKLRYFERGAFK